MQGLVGLMWLLVYMVAGELLARALALPFPGSVLGMLLLAASLGVRRVREPVAVAANVLLTHLSLLFVPAGVGVMAHLGLLRAHGGVLALILLISTALGLAATAATLRWLMRCELGESRVAVASKQEAQP